MSDKFNYVTLPPLSLYGQEIPLRYPLITYGSTGEKILLISDSLTVEEAHEGKLFFGAIGQVVSNTFDAAIKFNGERPAQVLSVTTRVTKRPSRLSDAQLGRNERRIIHRILQLIQRWRPTVVVFLGFHSFLQSWLPYVTTTERNYTNEQLTMLRGRLIPAKFGKHHCQFILSFSPRTFASQEYKFFKNKINLIGFVLNDFATAIHGKNRYTLPPLEPKRNKIIRSIQEFDVFFKELLQCKTPCFDTEGDNLNRVGRNRLLVIMVSLDGKAAYLIPIHHPETPLLPKEIEYILSKFRWYFESGISKFTTYHTAKFDITQFMVRIPLKYYTHRIYDVAVGEYFLDENRKFMRVEKIKGSYTLEFISAQYGALGYEDSPIQKSDRNRMADFSLAETMAYADKDVCYLFWIARFQIKEAKRRGPEYDLFIRTVCELGSDTILMFVEMEINGVLADKRYLTNLMAPNSAFMQEINKLSAKFKTSKAIHRVNKRLLRDGGVPDKSVSIFNGNGHTDGMTADWIFNINKQEHQQKLFFSELKLEPLEFRKDGGGKINKAFIKEHQDTVPEVKMLADWRSHQTINNTYITGLYKQLMENPDISLDNHLRAVYNFLMILTTRASASNPNLQNIPSHGDLAKIIERLFIAMFGKIFLKADYMAHEVKCWANVSGDSKIIASFIPGMLLRRKIRLALAKDPKLDYHLARFMQRIGWDDKIKDKSGKKQDKHSIEQKRQIARRMHNHNPELSNVLSDIIELQIKGDVHRVNYEFFFNKPAETVNAEERQSIKEVVFGVVYGKQAKALAENIYAKFIKSIRQKYMPKIRRAMRQKTQGVIQSLAEELTSEMENELAPYYNKAQNLIDKLSKKFHRGWDWLEQTQADGQENLRVVSVFGAVRHLWSYLHNISTVHHMMDRRAPNCVDMLTECLTENGWKFVDDLNIGDNIYTKNINTGRLELQPIQKITVTKYKGPMWRLNGGIDALVTPNHRWLVDYGKLQYQRSEMVTSNYLAISKSNNSLHLVADIPHVQKGGDWTDDEVRLIGWILTDGYFVKGNKKPNGNGRFNSRRIGITQSARGNPHKVQMIDDILQRLGIDFTRGGPEARTFKVTWRFFGELGDRIRIALPKKLLNITFLQSLSTRQLQLLYDTMLLGNGAFSNKLDIYINFGAGTKKKADAFSILCVLLGIANRVDYINPRKSYKKYRSMPNIPQQTRKFWIVRLKQRKRTQTKFYSSWIKYKGKVWCPTVLNGTFVARRNGSVYITGNSLIQGPASNMIFTAGRQLQHMVWQLRQNLVETGAGIDVSVHDSMLVESAIAMLPVTLYYMEHALTTLTHIKAREVYGFNMLVGLETEFEIGGCEAAMHKFDYRESTLLKTVGDSIDWMQKELGYKLDRDALLAKVKHNYRLINKYRIIELEVQGDLHTPNEFISLTPEKAAKLSWQI